MSGWHPPVETGAHLIATTENEAIVMASGELDVATVDCLDHALQAAAECSSSIHLDLGRVDFMDVRAVEVILRWARACHGAGGRLRLYNTAGEPHRILRLCGLERLIS